MKRCVLSQPDEPFFEKETRGGWDSWSPQREVVTAVVTPGDELSVGDDVVVDADASPFDVPGMDGTFVAQIEFGSWVEGQQVEVSSWEPRFEERLDEQAFRDAWGDWLRLPEPS